MTTNNTMKYRKKPVVIEAVRWMTDNANEIKAFVGKDYHFVNGSNLVIHTLEGHMICNPFDWVIRGIKGEFYPCKPDIFEVTYEPADAQPVAISPIILTDEQIDNECRAIYGEYNYSDGVMSGIKGGLKRYREILQGQPAPGQPSDNHMGMRMSKKEMQSLLYEFRDMWCQNIDLNTIDEFIALRQPSPPSQPPKPEPQPITLPTDEEIHQCRLRVNGPDYDQISKSLGNTFEAGAKWMRSEVQKRMKGGEG